MTAVPPSVRWRLALNLFVVVTYAASGAIAWTVIGFLLTSLPRSPWWIGAITIVYAVRFGSVEIRGLPSHSPEIRWQVPARWIWRKPWSIQSIVWGGLLGPGLVTRNPYASFWVLLGLASVGSSPILASLIGLAHGTMRAIGILHNRRLACDPADQSVWLTVPLYLTRDGLMMTVVVAGLLGYGVLTMMLR